ncbi:outer membrane protein assembly factor BamD [Hippea maritima]|uniref:Outer membrane assembly lipoprotein YfiO n=1 Tax=Hippea maritima (strain ATCC 700847 / DSM 10411 / MH2) TaxID=760142 RepID=F2LXD0_HIPMA|nr:outer membrane protein assembly factor BamD [Hippea maritima]AEA34244.1 outer membrane assembly lipoprotein YfiO [Hippea maritima DSM 10411]
MKKTIALLGICAIALAGCSSHKKIIPKEEEKPAYEWYNEGIQDYINHDYSEAEHALTMINAQHPGSIYAKRATIALGDVYFAKGEYILARDYYRKFIKLYPNSKEAVYAKYHIALSFYKARNGYKCDATPVREAIKEFLDLLDKYPNNPYKDKIYYYITKSVEELYKHELFVAKFYADLDEFNAAKNRLNYMYKHFKNVNFNDEMLFLLGKVYYHLGKKQQAKEFFKELIKKYPNSDYAGKAKEFINESSH